MSKKNEEGNEVDEYANLCAKVVNNVVIAIVTAFRSSLQESCPNESNRGISTGTLTVKPDDKLKALSQQISQISLRYIQSSLSYPKCSEKRPLSFSSSPTTNKKVNVDKGMISSQSSEPILDKTGSSSTRKNVSNSSTSASKPPSVASRKLKKGESKVTIKKTTSAANPEKTQVKVIKPNPSVPLKKTKSKRKQSLERQTGKDPEDAFNAGSQTVECCFSGQTQTLNLDFEKAVKSIQVKIETDNKGLDTNALCLGVNAGVGNVYANEKSQTEALLQNASISTTSLSDCEKFRNSTNVPYKENDCCFPKVSSIEEDFPENYISCRNDNNRENLNLWNSVPEVDSCRSQMNVGEVEYQSIASRLDETEKKLKEMWTKMFAITKNMQDHLVKCPEKECESSSKKRC